MFYFLKKIYDLGKNRFVLFLIFSVLFVGSNYYFTGNWLPSTKMIDLWFYTGLFMVLFSILFIEPYYTSPKNVITNTIPLLLVFLSIRDDFYLKDLWILSITIILTLLGFSIISMAFNDENKSPDHWRNRIAEFIKNVVVIFGRGKVIYSATFLLFLYLNVISTELDKIFDMQFIFLLVVWGIILAIDPQQLISTFSFARKNKDRDEIGTVFGVQSKKMFLVRLHEDRKTIKKFDVVKYRYSMQDSAEYAISGIIFDTYLLNQEKWAKVLHLGEIKESLKYVGKNVVYKITDKDKKHDLEKELNVNNFVGVVEKGSEIGTIKFEYSKRKDDIQEGDLLELKIGTKRLFYQVVGGMTEKEHLDGRNETGFIEGTAIQLGEWQQEKLSFQKFGWVPTINTPIFKADTSDITVEEIKYPNYKLGVIPGTTLPSILNLNEAVSHHTALLGVTGSGKSYLACEMIKELQQDTKVICVDFTGEWKAKLSGLNPSDLIDTSKLSELEEKIAQKETESTARNADKTKILQYKKAINDKLLEYVSTFVSSESNVALFELPELSNTMFILEFTQLFLEAVFSYAKNNPGQKICIVLEEAHTIIPETNFLGDLGDYGSSKALVSKMSQIALQGRKYGVGLIVIAQRTANVSKTVLTQCNTVVCFQAFDETSFNFLGNYVGRDLVKALPNLKQYHAIVTGKAVKANLPIIIDLKREE